MGHPGKVVIASFVVGFAAVGGEARADPPVPPELRSMREGAPSKPLAAARPSARESERSSPSEEALDEREGSAASERTVGMIFSLSGAIPLTWGIVELARTGDDSGDFAGLGRIAPFVATVGGALLAAIFVPLWVHGQYRLTAVRDERRRLRESEPELRLVPSVVPFGSGGGGVVIGAAF